jgi:hypothetical protein
MSYSDLEKLDGLLNFSGLWKEFAGWKTDRRIAFAQGTLAASLSRILIRAAQSDDIIKRIKREIEPILEDKDVVIFFVSALILNVLQYNFWISDWQNFFSTRNVARGLERHRAALAHFVNVSSSTISARAGLIATEILNNVIDPPTKIRALQGIFKAAMNFSSSDDELRHLAIDLMKYSHIESFFPEGPEKLASLKAYYHGIRNWGDTANRSDYWLQFGIALSIHGNLESDNDLNECKLAFKNATEREKARREPNLRRIDNYYSRFQLQMAVVERSPDEAFNLFWNGSLKLVKQIFDEETRHYPFKVGKLFTDIAAVHYRSWNGEKQGRFVQRCKEMLSFADERLERSRHRDVQFLSVELGKLLETITDQTSHIRPR